VSLQPIILTFVLFIAGLHFEGTDIAFGQFFEDSENNDTNTDTNSSSSEAEESNTAEIVLLSQKLKKASLGFRNLVGQVKNIGNDTAQFVQITVTTYDKDGNVLGTDFGYASATTLKPNQKSTFELIADNENFKGMDNYEISLQWRNPDFSEGYVENAQLYKDNSTKGSD